MKVLIAEFLWQHTEIIGTWLEFFSRRGADITIYYPQFNTTPHNYITIWGKFYKFKLDVAGVMSPAAYDLVVCNTTMPDVIRKLVADWPQTRFLAVGHYMVHSIAKWLSEDNALSKRVHEISVNPFFGKMNSADLSSASAADLPHAKFVLPVCRQLADAVADCRSASAAPSGKNAKNILIIGNSFKSVPPPIFNSFIGALQSAGFALTATLYGYNDISGYNFAGIRVSRDLPAIDLYKNIEESRFILFLPADYHYFNQLSGAIPLSLTFGRPLITFENVLTPYNLRSFYNIGDPHLIEQLGDDARYKEAQAYMEVRLNEIFAANAEILENSLRSLGLADN